MTTLFLQIGDKVRLKNIALGTAEEDGNKLIAGDTKFIGKIGKIDRRCTDVGSKSFFVLFDQPQVSGEAGSSHGGETRLLHSSWLELVREPIVIKHNPKFKVGDVVDGINCGENYKIEEIKFSQGEYHLKFDFYPSWFLEKNFKLSESVPLTPIQQEIKDKIAIQPTYKYVTIKNGDGQIFKITPRNTFINDDYLFSVKNFIKVNIAVDPTLIYFLNNQYLTDNDLVKVELKKNELVQITETKQYWIVQSFTESTVQLLGHKENQLEKLKLLVLTEEQKQLKVGDKVEFMMHSKSGKGIIKNIDQNLDQNQRYATLMLKDCNVVTALIHSLKKIPAKKTYIKCSINLVKE